jgi:hypothetical protein
MEETTVNILVLYQLQPAGFIAFLTSTIEGPINQQIKITI